MRKGGAKSKEKPCNICDEGIKLRQQEKYMQCANCSTIVHRSCAANSREIACNGLFYCTEHLNLAPKEYKRNLKDREGNLQSDIRKEALPINVDTNMLAEALQKALPSLIPLPHQNVSQPVSRIEQPKPQFYRQSYDALARKPNAPKIQFPKSHDSCVNCGGKNIIGKFFSCVACQNTYHDDCVRGAARICEISGF